MNIEELVRLSYDKNSEADQDYIDKMIPELITFKIGDLLRCKCASHESEIVAIYR